MYLSQQDAAWAAETMEKIKMKMKPVTERSRSKIPYTTVDGVFDDRKPGYLLVDQRLLGRYDVAALRSDG